MSKRIERIKTKIRKTDSIGMFHDSRSDVRILAKLVNTLIDKVNELTDANNDLQDKLDRLSVNDNA